MPGAKHHCMVEDRTRERANLRLATGGDTPRSSGPLAQRPTLNYSPSGVCGLDRRQANNRTGGMFDRRTSFGFKSATLWAAAGLIGLFSVSVPSHAFQLVTVEEAALPPDNLPALKTRGSPTRRPKITIVRPSPNAGVLQSPVQFKLLFRSFGGAQIDPDSVLITYLKQPRIDMTQRVMSFISPVGIDILQAEVPPGHHRFWIEIKDNDGRIGGVELAFDVAK